MLTSFWFALSIGGRRSEDWLHGTVVDVQEVVPGEVWSVTVCIDGDGTRVARLSCFYVLESTCEVIGHAAASNNSSVAAESNSLRELRVDWSAYIRRRMEDAPDRSSGRGVVDHLKWANYEEYDRGISRLWFKRLVKQGELGKAKRTIAERYIMASVVANRYAIGTIRVFPAVLT